MAMVGVEVVPESDGVETKGKLYKGATRGRLYKGAPNGGKENR